MLDLLAQEWDVIVFGATYWRPWPQPVQQALAEKVAAGTGFVYVWPYGDYFARTMKGMRETRAEESFVRDALPMKLIPPWDKLEPAGMVRLHEHAKGRVALLDYPVLPDSRGIRAKSPGGLTPRNPITDASFPFWEYHHSLLAKAMIWSSRRMPDARIVSLQADPAQSPVEARASVALVGNLRNDADRVRDLKAHVWAHDEMGERLETTPVAVSAAARKETAFLVRLPVARHSGPHLATVWLREGDKTLDWATVSFQVDGPVRMEKVGDLPAVVSEGDWVEAKAKVTAGRRVPVTVHAEIRDSLGRLLAEERQEVVLKAGEQEVSAGLSPTRAVIGRHRLNLTLLMGDARLARLSLPFGVDCRRYDDYVSILWGAGDGSYTQPVMQRVIAETESFDAVVTGAGRAGAYEHSEAFAEAVSASGLGVYAINLYHLSCKEAGLIRKPCLTNPEDRKAIRRDIREKGDWLARFAPLAYLLGDEMSLGPENGFTDFCQSPTCLAGFRRYLEDAYGRVGRLNAAWKTKFDSFDDAQPLTFSDAQRSGNYAPWADHRAYMDKVYARAFVLARDALAKRDPRPMVGYSGGGTWNIAVNGYNRWELYQVCKAVTDYGPDTPDILRSFMSGDHIGSWWWGMYDGGPENARRHTPWGLILRGLNGSGFYCAYGAGHSLFSDYGLLDPGFVPKKNVVADLREDVKPLREGLGKLLLSSRRLNSGIAIHYSQPCVRAAYVANEKPVDERLWNRARWGMEIALKDLGLSYDLISPAQIEEGRLEDFRVLVLPLSQALSEDEADQIARFVRRGGALLADPLAGRFDEHLVPQSPRRLEEVLGVSGGSPSVVRGEVGFQEKSPILAGGTLATTVLCRDVRARGAAVWANLSPSDIPAVLYRAHGKGAAYTLNFTFAQYVDARASERGQDFAEFLDGLLARHDVRPDVRVLKGGQRERGVEVSIFESGKTAFIGLLQDSEVKPIAGDEARIQFTRFGRLYDVRARQYVGEQSMLVTEFRPCRGRLFALLPEQPPRPAVTAPAKPVKAGQPVEVRVQQPTKARFGRVIRVEVAAPDGKPRPYYARNLFSLDGDCRVAIPLALNDPAGEWVVTARDVVTGETGEATFRYGPPAP
jgi:hypothetical protein